MVIETSGIPGKPLKMLEFPISEVPLVAKILVNKIPSLAILSKFGVEFTPWLTSSVLDY
jgi:hypothetical protein